MDRFLLPLRVVMDYLESVFIAGFVFGVIVMGGILALVASTRR